MVEHASSSGAALHKARYLQAIYISSEMPCHALAEEAIFLFLASSVYEPRARPKRAS